MDHVRAKIQYFKEDEGEPDALIPEEDPCDMDAGLHDDDNAGGVLA
jgi:hypothetical protein